MRPPTPPRVQCLEKGLGKLTGFDNWHTWHMKARMALQTRGLRYLLNDDGPPDMPDDFEQYDTDRATAVGLLVGAMSEGILERAYRRGWKPEDATVTGTLNTLETIFGDEQQARRDEDERAKVLRRRLADLARMDLDAGAQTVREYILTAKHNHDSLLLHYGENDIDISEGYVSPAEGLLEQLFVTSLVEGLRTARPEWYAKWMEKMTEGTLGSTATRVGVTEWLLGKDAADQKERDAAIAAAAAIASQSRRESALEFGLPAKPTAKPAAKPAANQRPPPKKAKTNKGQKQRCSYCADHHPSTWPHDDDACWYLHPHKAPRTWQDRYRGQIASLREGQWRDSKRKRSPSPLTSMRCL